MECVVLGDNLNLRGDVNCAWW